MFNDIAKTPQPPYYAAIFTGVRTEGDRGYGKISERMVELAAQQPGFLGAESARTTDGFGITVSYWSSEEAIAGWKAQAEHQIAQQTGQGACGTPTIIFEWPKWKENMVNAIPDAQPA